VYATAGTNKWAAPSLDGVDSLTYDTGSSTYCRKLPGGACVVFDSNGWHTATRGRLSIAGVSTWGFRTNFKYGSGAQLDTVEIPLASGAPDRWVFRYSSALLDSVTAPANPGATRTVKVYRNTTTGQVDSIADPDSQRVRFTYVSGTNRIASRHDKELKNTTFSYDAGGKLSQVSIEANATEWITTGLQALESRGFATGAGGTPVTPDKAYTLIDGPRSDVADSTLIWLNGYGAPRRVRDAVGHATNLTYSGTWPALVTEVADPAGVVTVATYNASTGRLATQTVRSPYGNADSTLTSFHWNGWDQVDSIVPALGPRSKFGYDSVGNRLWQQTGPDSTRVSFAYYGSSHHAGLLRNVAAPGIATDSVVYDAKRGNVAEYLGPGSPLRFKTRYVQDSIGRVTKVISPIDTSQTKHDTTTTIHDVMDRVTRTETKAPDPWQTMVVETDYDLVGRPLEVRRSSIPETAGVGELTTTWAYDWAGRKVVETDNFAETDSTRYDLAGNVVRVKTRRAHEITMRYDAMGRLLERVVPG
jgi:YD repeat-containing protein